MTDLNKREKVISRFQEFIDAADSVGSQVVVTEDNTARDVLALLKAQEPVEPIVMYGAGCRWYKCGKCKMPIYPLDKYCRECGQAVKWE